MKTDVHLWYLTELFLEWEMFETNVVENQNTHFVINNTFTKNHIIYKNVEKYGIARQAKDDNMVHVLCTLKKKDYRFTLRICITYCFSMVTMVTWLCWILCHVHCWACVDTVYFLIWSIFLLPAANEIVRIQIYCWHGEIY